MEQYKKQFLSGKVARKTVCFFLVVLFFTVQVVTAQVVNDWGTLRTQVGPSGPTTIDIGSITVGNIDTAIEVNRENLTLQGGTTSNFATKIGDVSGYMSSKTPASMTATDFNTWVTGWSGGINPGSLSEIKGNSITRKIETTYSEENKWLTTRPLSPSGGNGLNLKDIHFHNVDVEYSRTSTNGRYVNGLIGNNHNALEFTSLGDITGNAFTGINVKLTSTDEWDYLAGGGVIGVRSTGATAEMGIVSGNYFQGINITTTGEDGNTYVRAGEFDKEDSPYLEGGGLVGVNAVTSPDDKIGHAYMRELSKNYFTDIHILTNDVLLGGGLVGLNNNSKHQDTSNTYGLLDDAIGNIFGNGQTGNIKVEVGYSLRGGGILGLNGLSSASVELKNLQSNAFAGVSVETGSYIRGGGIVGLQTNDGEYKEDPNATDDMKSAKAHLENASGNLFLNNEIIAGTYLHGGGVIGLRGNMGEASLGTLTINSSTKNVSVDAKGDAIATGGLHNNVFKGMDVVVGSNNEMPAISGTDILKYLYGGGIVGVSGFQSATLASATNNYFDELTVKVHGQNNVAELYGGGFIGVDSWDTVEGKSATTIGNIHNNAFLNSTNLVNVLADSIHGGGIVGVSNDTGTARIESVKENMFDRLKVQTNADLVGGGILGAWANEETSGTAAKATIGRIEGNEFKNLTVTAGDNLKGGGVIGVWSYGVASIDTIARNDFVGNTIRANGYIDGGGIIGVTGRGTSNPTSGIKLIDAGLFKDNNVSADEMVMGGLVYTYGLAEVMTIRDSVFVNNTLKSDTDIVYGTVTVDTGVKFSSLNAPPHTLTLTATNGNSTVFDNNKINDKDNVSDPRYNSLYFGTIPDPNTGDPDYTKDNAKLIVDPKAGGVVALYDPIRVNQLSESHDKYTFNMEVTGAGNFVWGGNNVFELNNEEDDTDIYGTVTLKKGSTTTILDGSSATTYLNGNLLPMLPRYTMSLDAPNFTFNLENGARLNVEGHNYFDFSGNAGTSPVANLNGNLHFNLNNTSVYHEGEVPGVNYAGDLAYQPLLTIKVPENGQGMVNLANSTVTLSDFAAGQPLKAGDRFYLIELDNGPTFKGSQDNKAFTVDNPLNDSAYARQGLTVGYDFIIDKNGENWYQGDENDPREVDTRFLVARLRGIGPPGEFNPPNTGRITVITFLDQFPDLPLYDYDPPCHTACGPCNPCNPCNPCDPCAPVCGVTSTPSGWVWTPLGDVQGAWYRANTGNGSHADVRGFQALAGAAAQKRVNNGRIYFGAFADVGNAGYNTFNHVPTNDIPDVHGSGDLDTVGGGVFLRRKWNSGFRVDTMVRAGNLKNSFVSYDLLTNGLPARLNLNNAYLGTSLGLTKNWKYGMSDFDVYSRYRWLMDNGGHTVISTGELVDFKALHSHRLTSGGRWTRQWNAKLASYFGAAYEHEFDGSTMAVERNSGYNLVLEGPTLRGGTGVGEVGMIVRRNQSFHVTFGVEGYVGKREGFSGNLAAMWRW